MEAVLGEEIGLVELNQVGNLVLPCLILQGTFGHPERQCFVLGVRYVLGVRLVLGFRF
jgi:hypothetical protein